MSPVSPEKEYPEIFLSKKTKNVNIFEFSEEADDENMKENIFQDSRKNSHQIWLNFSPSPIEQQLHAFEEKGETGLTEMATVIEVPFSSTSPLLTEDKNNKNNRRENDASSSSISSLTLDPPPTTSTTTHLIDPINVLSTCDTSELSLIQLQQQQQQFVWEECPSSKVECAAVTTDTVATTPELGAEVVICSVSNEDTMIEDIVVEQEIVHEDNRDIPDLVHDVNGTHLINDRQREAYSRRISYEEVVHQEESVIAHDHGCVSLLLSEQKQNEEVTPSMEKCLIALTQWALTLQDVYEDRLAGPVKPGDVDKCQCAKADQLMRELKRVESDYYDVIGTCDKAAINPNLSEYQVRSVQNLTERVREAQGLLKSVVSIRISSPTADVKSKAAFLVGEVCDVRQYVRDAVDSLVQLVYDLMQVTECQAHSTTFIANKETYEESEMCLGVASLRTSDDDLQEEDEEGDKESGRKRKQQLKVINNKCSQSPQTSPTSSPSKRPRRCRALSAPSAVDTQALELLESKRKAVRNNGLLQYVLWREALKAEKDRVDGTDSPTKIGSTNKRRLSYQ